MNIFRHRLFTGGLACALTLTAAAAPRPNVLLIFADDLGIGDVSCYGSEIQTPHIDSLARDGAKFEAFYVAAPACTPSRFGLLTGRYPNRSRDQLLGALMFLQPRDDTRGIRAGETTVAEMLQRGGYRTAIIGKWHLGHGLPEFSSRQHGFDYSYGSQGGCVDYFTLRYGEKPDWFRNDRPLVEEGYATDVITDDAVRWLEQQRTDKPFFLYLAYTAPHYGKGWDAAKQQPTNILQAKPADRARYAHIADADRREYAGMVAALDDGVGRVLETLRAAKLDQNTLVIFTSDNGGDPRYGGGNKPFRGQKNQLFEGGIREPCVMRWPGKIKPASVVRTPATALDLFPTFCDLAGVKRGGMALDGDSLMPLLLEGKPLPTRDLFWQRPKDAALRRGEWKYLRDATGEMLFNLKSDPAEANDLAAEKPKVLRQLKAAHAAIAATLPER
jgi:arylsulfatase A-like enzyme